MTGSHPGVRPLFGAADDEWVVMVGRYILNMGCVEFGTRLIIERIEGTDRSQISSDDLAKRISFIRKRFPQRDASRHKSAMKSLAVAMKHTKFRNIVAHSPLFMSSDADGSLHIHGILDLTPNSAETRALVVSLDELRGRVDESAAIGRDILAMQADFS